MCKLVNFAQNTPFFVVFQRSSGFRKFHKRGPAKSKTYTSKLLSKIVRCASISQLFSKVEKSEIETLESWMVSKVLSKSFSRNKNFVDAKPTFSS